MDKKPSKITLMYEDSSSGIKVTHELIDVIQLEDLLAQVASFLNGAGFSLTGLEPIYSETVEHTSKEILW